MAIFSERMGIIPTEKSLQLNSINDELRNSLWNVLYEIYKDIKKNYWLSVAKAVAKNFRKYPLDELPHESYRCQSWLKSYFYQLKWNEIYDFIEFVVENHERMTTEHTGYTTLTHPIKKSSLISVLNYLLERELSGYRFIAGVLTPIANKVEINEIESVLSKSKKLGLNGVNEHIQTAIELLGKKPDPDYRNAIKEAISAVESISKQITKSQSKGLEGALNRLSQITQIHGALKSGFIKLYGYASDEDGIRHAIQNEPNVGFSEAKYMIVSCSAFVNYLLQKRMMPDCLIPMIGS